MPELRRRRNPGEERQPGSGARADDVDVRSRRDGEARTCTRGCVRLFGGQHRAGTDEHSLHAGRTLDRGDRGVRAERDLDAGDAALEQRSAQVVDHLCVVDRHHR